MLPGSTAPTAMALALSSALPPPMPMMQSQPACAVGVQRPAATILSSGSPGISVNTA